MGTTSIILGIGDLGASNTPGEVIKTLGLGSCVAIVSLDPATRTVGMVHVALPDSSVVRSGDVRLKPGRFADTALPALFKAMARGGMKDPRGLVIKLVGGAAMMDADNTFNIGKRNVLAIKKALWELGTGPLAEDIGGNISRSVSVSVDTGEVWIHSPGRGDWMI